jgi:hypothetical protein
LGSKSLSIITQTETTPWNLSRRWN